MTDSTFTQRKMSVSFTLTSGSFSGSGGANTVTLDGYRMKAVVVKAGSQSQGELQLLVYGMKLSLMNQLSTLGKTPVFIGKNSVTLSAGDDQSGLATVFQGTISQAYTDLGSAPDAVFQVTAYAGLYQALQTIVPTSYPESFDTATAMSSLATKMGLNFENNGVSVQLPTSYFPGSAKGQMDAIARAANIEAFIDNGVLAIWPKDGSRGGSVPDIGPDSGLVGYPFPSGQGLLGLKTIFNPTITFGGKVQVRSSITPANGTWSVVHLTHNLDTIVPKGQWFTTIIGTPPGYLTLQ